MSRKISTSSIKHQTARLSCVPFAIKGLKKPIPMRVCVLQHPLQNRVPRVQVLLPLPQKNGLNMRFKPFFLMSFSMARGLFEHVWCSSRASIFHCVTPVRNISVWYIIILSSILLLIFQILRLSHSALRCLFWHSIARWSAMYCVQADPQPALAIRLLYCRLLT